MKAKSVIWGLGKVEIPGVRASDYNRETAFQIYCATWLRKQFELTGNERFRWWHHSANERMGSGFQAKMMGQNKGFPDFVQFDLRIAIELKIPGGKASKEQLKWLEYFRTLGWSSEIVFQFERFRDIVLEKLARR